MHRQFNAIWNGNFFHIFVEIRVKNWTVRDARIEFSSILVIVSVTYLTYIRFRVPNVANEYSMCNLYR